MIASGGSAQPDSGDTSSSPADYHFDSAGTGNEDPTGGQDLAADTASDSQERAGSTVAGSDEMSSWDASADEQDRRAATLAGLELLEGACCRALATHDHHNHRNLRSCPKGQYQRLR